MAEYIERENAYTLAKKICDAVNSRTRTLFLGRDILDWIDEIPAADVVPASDFRDCRNELCLKCGAYTQKHNGACDGCRWRKANG